MNDVFILIELNNIKNSIERLIFLYDNNIEMPHIAMDTNWYNLSDHDGEYKVHVASLKIPLNSAHGEKYSKTPLTSG
jgi:hypothetical protein